MKIDVDGYLSSEWEQHCREQEEFQELLDKVLAQIEQDVYEGDLTAVEELLRFVPVENLVGFLSEGGV